MTDYHTDLTRVDYIISEFEHYWETPWGVTDSKFDTCRVDRPRRGDPFKLMGIMNHMLNKRAGDIKYPDQKAAPVTNSLESIQKQIDLCIGLHTAQPNVVLVSTLFTGWSAATIEPMLTWDYLQLDWVNIGDAAKAQRVLNRLQ